MLSSLIFFISFTISVKNKSSKERVVAIRCELRRAEYSDFDGSQTNLHFYWIWTTATNVPAGRWADMNSYVWNTHTAVKYVIGTVLYILIRALRLRYVTHIKYVDRYFGDNFLTAIINSCYFYLSNLINNVNQFFLNEKTVEFDSGDIVMEICGGTATIWTNQTVTGFCLNEFSHRIFIAEGNDEYRNENNCMKLNGSKSNPS